MPEPLHWVMSVTRSDELVVNEPFPGAHGSREHCRTTVTVEDVAPVLETVLTTVMSQVMPVVAPRGPPLRLLHWPSATLAAFAGDVLEARPTTENAAARRSASANDAHRAACGRPDIGAERVVTGQALPEDVSSPDWATRHEWQSSNQTITNRNVLSPMRQVNLATLGATRIVPTVSSVGGSRGGEPLLDLSVLDDPERLAAVAALVARGPASERVSELTGLAARLLRAPFAQVSLLGATEQVIAAQHAPTAPLNERRAERAEPVFRDRGFRGRTRRTGCHGASLGGTPAFCDIGCRRLVPRGHPPRA